MTSNQRVYLDYNATTPLEPEVLESIHGALKDSWGNPSSSHDAGISAKSVIDTARKHIANAIGATSEDIIFTSGGTEANNLVIWTVVKEFKRNVDVSRNTVTSEKPHVVTSNIEHDSIKLVLQNLEKEDIAEVTYVPVSKSSGRVEVDDVMAAIRPNTCLVTIMMANNETGIIQPIEEISLKVRALNKSERKKNRILLHTDVAQTIGKIKVNVNTLLVDYATIVGQKFYGPRIGALYVKSPGNITPIHPMFYGGGQERNFRPGTENTGMIAGLGKAAELVVGNLDDYQTDMEDVRDYLEKRLQDQFGDRIHFNGKYECSTRIPNTCNFSIMGPGLEGSRVLSRCKHLQASVGAACHSSAGSRASPILLASGVPADVAKNAIRMSVGRQTSKEDIDLVINDLKQAVDNIQKENQLV